MLPRVILYTAMSLDGRITNFPADLDLYYALAARWNPDAILFGSETVLAASRQDPSMEVPPDHEQKFTPTGKRRHRPPSAAGNCRQQGESTLLGCYPEVALHAGPPGIVLSLNTP